MFHVSVKLMLRFTEKRATVCHICAMSVFIVVFGGDWNQFPVKSNVTISILRQYFRDKNVCFHYNMITHLQ